MIEDLGVAEAALGSRDCAVVDHRGLRATAGSDMPVDRVVAGVHGPAREPAVEGWRRIIEHPCRLGVPVDQPGRFAPEPAPVGHAPAELLRITTHAIAPLGLPLRRPLLAAVPARCGRLVRAGPAGERRTPVRETACIACLDLSTRSASRI